MDGILMKAPPSLKYQRRCLVAPVEMVMAELSMPGLNRYPIQILYLMMEPLIEESEQKKDTNRGLQQSFPRNQPSLDPNKIVTFRECLKLTEGEFGSKFQKKIFIMMAAFWIFASFFVSLEFYLFKKPIYCMILSEGLKHCCKEGDDACAQEVCSKFPGTIKEHVLDDNSLTYQFGIFCGSGYEWLRIVLKILPESLAVVGMLIYGAAADRKGRKVAITICWRMYTFGVILFSVTITSPLRILGYVIACIHCYPSLISQFTLLFELNIEKSRNKSSLLLLACLFVGPLTLSLLSEFILKMDTRLMLCIFCAIPALILSLLTSKIIESPIFTYPFNKIFAFNILNKIAKENKQLPILIDLSRSHWHKQKIPEESFITLLRNNRLILKLIFGVFFMFTIYLAIKVSQVSLDPFTDAHTRSILINVPTAIADITLCFYLHKFMKRTCRIMFIGNCALIITMIVMKSMDDPDRDSPVSSISTRGIIEISTAVMMRYLSELCYGVILIWAIETFPTINRSYCVGMVVGGSSLGVILVYWIKDAYYIELLSITLACSILVIVFENFLELNSFGKMIDTYEGKHYDEHDRFYRF